jgi:hypothetical protein
MSRYDARQTPTPQPEPQRSKPSTSAGRPWMDSLRRDAQEFGHVAEYEFRKVVGASRSLIQRQPAAEPAPQKARRAARFERKPIGGRPVPERQQPESVREAKPVVQAIPQPE